MFPSQKKVKWSFRTWRLLKSSRASSKTSPSRTSESHCSGRRVPASKRLQRPTYEREEQSERAAGAAARESAQRGPATRAREISTHVKLPSASTTTRPRHARDARLSHATPLSPLLSHARIRFPQAGDDECNRHVIRHYHKKGEPHKAIEYCLEQVEKRLANGGTFLHDTIKTHGAPTTQWLAELQRLAAAAPGDAAAEGQTDETGAATPSTATSTPHFIPGTMKTNIGTLKSVVKFLRAQGDKPQVLFSFEAETGDESLRTIEVRMPTLKNVCAPWADRKLTGPESFAALACDTALVLAAAPDAMFYLPPRINDIYFWSTNQRPWLDVMILDEFIYQIDPHRCLFITGTPFSVQSHHTAPRPSNARCRDRILVPHAGDKPKDDCVMGPSVPGEVRQNRSHVLLNKTKLLGVGFKSNNGADSGRATFGGKTLADEIKALRGEHHVTVLVKQTPDSQAPPEYCVVTPPDVEQFAKVARMGSDTEVSYSKLKKHTNLKFVPVADAAQQLVDAYKKYSRFASRARERRGRVVDT